jgi:SAM-dependent methyltransferase
MFDGKYLDWNQKRIKGIVDFYGHRFFFFKKVLDLGCGYADISGVLYRLGGHITAVDARQEHLKIASRKYPGIKTVKADLDRGWPFYGQNFDFTLDLDMICHLNNYEEHLRSVCLSTQFLVLETAVCDSDDPKKVVVVPENKNIYDLSINGVSSRPSPAAIERVLKECGMNFKRQDNSKYNSGSYVYDWKPKNDGSTDYNKRRLWFCVKNTNPLQFETSNNSVPMAPPPPANMGFVPSLRDTKVPVSQAYVLNPYLKAKQESKEPIGKLKTALCISGHLRTFVENFESVRINVLERMDCDVFIHTWDSLGLSYRPCDARVYAIETQRLIDKINELYKPKKLVVEPMKEFKINHLMRARLLDHRDIGGILSMYYKIEECNKLKTIYEKENNITYDCVVRFRGDLFMEMPIPVDTNTNLNFLFIPMYGNFGGICDQFAYGSSHIMDSYASLYSNIQKYLENGAPMHPERLLQFHIDASRLPVAKVNVRFLIKRSNGLIQDNMLLERAWGFLK